jgi:hypothetical protein
LVSAERGEGAALPLPWRQYWGTVPVDVPGELKVGEAPLACMEYGYEKE